MNRLLFGVSGLVLSLLVVTVVLAAEDQKPPKTTGPGDTPSFGMQMPLLTPKMLEKLNLSDEQKEKVDALVKKYGEKQKESMKKLHDTMEKFRKDMNPGDRAKMAQSMQEFMASSGKQHTEAEGKLKALLTEEQKKKYEELKKELPTFPTTFPPFGGPNPTFPPGMMRPFPGQIIPPFVEGMLKLSKEQKEKIAKVQKEAEDKVMEILNEEQKKQVETMKKAFEKSFPGGTFPPRETPRKE